MKKYLVAALGDRGSILGFQAMQFELIAVSDREEARKKLSQAIASSRYAVLYITSQVALDAKDIIEQNKEKPLPAIVLLPDGESSCSLGMQSLSQAAQKAIGFDILAER